jgi:hypothetical protein
MACCGQGRMALRDAAGTIDSAGARGAGKAERRILLEYRAAAPVTVRGVATGRLYQFDAASPRQHVAEADARALLRTPFFAQID